MKSWIIAAVIAGILAIWSIGSYNGLVTAEENVNQSYAQVQNVLDRQFKLIPNLVETVKGYASHEEKVFTQVAAARSALSAVNKMDPKELANNPDLQKKVIEAQAQVNGTLAQLNAVKEAYPQLQANENFKTLMAELAGSINRVTVERRRNQQAVQEFNRSVRTFPRVIFASIFGFHAKPYFEASAEAQEGPKVKF